MQREIQYAHEASANDASIALLTDVSVVSLTCAVSTSDWRDVLEYASQSSRILPALGIHPWYLGDILVDDIEDVYTCNTESHIEKYIDWDWLTELETHLSKHPRLLVGEIGLCKMARFVREFPKDKGDKATALQLQKLVFSKQLDLAARWSRPVKVHCVDAHGIFMEMMWDKFKRLTEDCRADEKVEASQCWRRAFPPAIAMHSFTGTAHHINEILEFERALLCSEEGNDVDGKLRRRKPIKQKAESNNQPSENDERDILFYFGVSHSINHVMCTSEKARRKGIEAVRSIPSQRLMVESDVHSSADVTLGTAGAVAYVAHVRGEIVQDVAQRCVVNGLRFLTSLGSIISYS